MSDFWSGPLSTSILHVCEQRRLWWDCAGRLCDKYHNLMSWLEWKSSKPVSFIKPFLFLAHLMLSVRKGNLIVSVPDRYSFTFFIDWFSHPIPHKTCWYNKTYLHGLRQILCHLLCIFLLPLITAMNYTFIYEPRIDKTNKMAVCPAKTQISLGIRPVWTESSLCTQWVAKDPSFLHADSEDSDQTRQMPSLNWGFARRTVILLALSCHGSIIFFRHLRYHETRSVCTF